MVSIGAYSISEYVFFIIFFYLLMFMVYLSWMSVGILSGINNKKLIKRTAFFVCAQVIGMIIFALPIRLGTVMFINGALFVILIGMCFRLILEARDRMQW